MEAICMQRAIEKGGETLLTGLPYKKGQHIEMILMVDSSKQPKHPRLTARELLQSELIGLWEDRSDDEDSAAYARQLREQAQNRRDR